jgi:hypothetical protein
MDYVCDPDTPDAETSLGSSLKEFVPKRLVQFL